jgi:hypothetical protein
VVVVGTGVVVVDTGVVVVDTGLVVVDTGVVVLDAGVGGLVVAGVNPLKLNPSFIATLSMKNDNARTENIIKINEIAVIFNSILLYSICGKNKYFKMITKLIVFYKYNAIKICQLCQVSNIAQNISMKSVWTRPDEDPCLVDYM